MFLLEDTEVELTDSPKSETAYSGFRGKYYPLIYFTFIVYAC